MGPIWYGDGEREPELLACAYEASFACAFDEGTAQLYRRTLEPEDL